MEKSKTPFFKHLKTILIILLTLSMLLLAGIYIGGAQFSAGNTAIKTADLPEGAVPLGQDAPKKLPIYEKDLLPISFAGIRYGEQGGGAYGTEQAAKALFDFAAETIHACLSQGASITAVTAEQYAAATKGNCISLHFLSSLPYQMLYALTGEIAAAAGSETAISADRVLLSFTASGKTTLYLSNGSSFYAADGGITVKISELAAMAHDSRLRDFTLTESGIALSADSPAAPKVSIAPASLDAAQYANILSLLGYNPETGIAAVAATDGDFSGTAVAPHGTVRVDSAGLFYTAARDSGITISDFLDTAKSELDIGMYDILYASVSLVEQLRAIAPQVFGGEGEPYLAGFYRQDDIFTVVFGLCATDIEISGDAYPYFAKLTVQGGIFKSMDFRFANVRQNSYTGSLFPSAWPYTYAARSASLCTLRLYYRADALSDAWIDAAWYFTLPKEATEVEK